MKGNTAGTILFAALTAAGCQSTNTLSYPIPRHEVFQVPPINVEFHAEIGQPIITRVDGLGRPALRVAEPVSFSFENNTYKLKSGLYRIDGVAPSYSQVTVRDRVESADADVIQSKISLVLRDGQCELIPLMIQASPTKDAASSVPENIKGIVVGERVIFGTPSSTEADAKTKGQKIDRAACFSDYDFNPNQPGSSKRELVYLGQSGETLRFKYREYYDNLVRAAFSNDVTYNIEEDNVIGFRGARIEVISASNTELMYRVLSPMGD